MRRRARWSATLSSSDHNPVAGRPVANALSADGSSPPVTQSRAERPLSFLSGIRQTYHGLNSDSTRARMHRLSGVSKMNYRLLCCGLLFALASARDAQPAQAASQEWAHEYQ